MEDLYTKQYHCCKMKDIKKLDKLKIEKIENVLKVYNLDWIKNISDTELPGYVERVLSLGSHFNIHYRTCKDIPFIRIISSIESSIYANENANDIRFEITNIIANFLQKVKKERKADWKWLMDDIYLTENFLKINPQIIVAKADKSNCTVVMNTEEYKSKILDVLGNENNYKKQKKDITNEVIKKVKDLTESLLCIEEINPL